MKRPFRRATGAFMIALALLALTGTALADSGNGNSANAPGQVKQADATPASQPAQPSSQAPGQEKKATTPSSTAAPSSSPGQAKQQTKAATSTPGVKPSNTTTHKTSCTTGMSGTAVTCSGNGPKSDSSKQYGNGKTAAQIATSNGAPAGTMITGPGNSQPHKVTSCKHSHAVDVHAVKSYDASACQATQLQPSVQTSSSSVCGKTTIVTQSTQVFGVLHGKSAHLMTNPKSAHFTKHGDQQVLGTVSSTQVVPTGESCGSRNSTESSQQTQQTQQAQQTQQSSAVSAQIAAAQSQDVEAQGVVSAQSAAPASPTAQATPATGGVLGATANLNAPKPQRGGVLGAVTNVAGSTLPFTGFPLWIAVLVAAVLIAAGLMLRGRGTTSRI
jgi:hypothetical protein